MKKLLLQACCGPCTIAALKHFENDFCVTLFFYGSNFDSEQEYERRFDALETVNKNLNFGKEIIKIQYQHDSIFNNDSFAGKESEPEGGSRCTECIKIRLRNAALHAKKLGFDCFSTSLTVSPHKDSELVNEIGRSISNKLGIAFIEADLKKNCGFQKSVEISKQLGLYRQNYCGCKFSKNSR